MPKKKKFVYQKFFGGEFPRVSLAMLLRVIIYFTKEG